MQSENLVLSTQLIFLSFKANVLRVSPFSFTLMKGYHSVLKLFMVANLQ